ncbi:helix-turn-helix transcriptional regulator [Streptomyces sp. ME19-01-6]|uniref:helix-turn-helix domain-containing protein n=1 Tax=Streptomyces sp. ME19-01-6 TaxID=3028686 RepID=UPI0029A5A65C|nr:helix-turn-helix transcriptional regulator [Streptomyces sp. ME19-01-6]MDX3233235.1 helix-turn-helix transcriptional regulator [Streptomyces sp. ME19-01-6]
MDESISSEDFNNPPLNPLQRYGADVRRVRLGRKLTQKHLATSTGYSVSYVSQVESGKLLPSEKFASGCDRVFGTNGLFTGMLRRLEEGDHPTHFVPYVQLEQKASHILNFSATIIVGMLQTEEYARAIFRAGHPFASDEVIQGKVAARIRRRDVLDQDRPPKLWAVLHEACLRTYVGGPAVMADQLEFLVKSAARPGIDLQVIPFTAGAAAAHSVPFTLLTFKDSPTVLYSDDPQGGRLCRTAATVTVVMQNYDRLRAHALPPDESLAFIETVREEYTS